MANLWSELHPVLRRIIVGELILVAILILAAAAAKAAPMTCVVHRGEWVWIREAPSRSARQIGRVRYGYEIDAGEPENGYFRIAVRPGWLLEGESAAEGYVDAQYFDRAVPETMYRVITSGPLAKRETPQGRLLCWIKPGVKISVLGWRYAPDGSLWAKVYKGGYVCGSYLGAL